MMKNFLLVLLLLVGANLFAQKQAKKTLTIDDFAAWKTIVNPLISNNGKYVVYELNPQKGDGNLIIVHNNSSDTIPRGKNAKIGSNSDFAVFNIKQTEKQIRKAKIEKVKKDKMPKDSLGIFLFKEMELIKYPKSKSFKLAEENANWLAFLTEPSKEKKDTSENTERKKILKQPGDKLVLFNVKTKDTLEFKNVTEYTFAKMGAAIYFVQQTKDSVNTYSSLKKFATENSVLQEISNSEGWIKKVTCNEEGEKYAYLHSKDTIDEKIYSLYSGDVSGSAELIVNQQTKGIPVGWSPSENGTIYFSKNGMKLYFGTAEMPKPEPKDSLLDEDKPKVDIWNWKDLKLQPQQKIEAERNKKRTFLAVYFLNEKKLMQLADIHIKSVSTLKKGDLNVGLGYNADPYQRESSWTGKSNRDYYLLDFESGIKRQILTEQSNARLSPQGKYLVWYNTSDSSYYSKSTNINLLDTISLTKVIPVSFYEETHDSPSDPRPYGIAGFSEDDRFVYIYDRYDIWKLDVSGEKVPVNMTKTFGRRNATRLRYVKLDKDLDYIPGNETILLSAIDERTMSRGYFGTKLNAVKDPDLLVMDKYMFGRPQKAKEADKILWTKQNVSIFPDLWCSNLSFLHAKKMSTANAEQEQFVWPEVKLVEWNSFSGETLKGLLYTPENLNPNKKYPMVVYFYERNSENLYRHQHPFPSRSTINKSFYASNGYVVFVPDITYKNGYPGESAYNAIVSGTQYLTNNYSFIDKDKIGLQGQSWGGYQTAWLVTKTDMYAAGMAGAPVSNMTSAYGGIRWQTGMSRMFQYEHSQSRIGGTLWEKPLLYIENSPVFFAPKVKTPLLMMHNDNDGAVPWYQGIEYFVALRRLNKPVWMLTYNGEPHNLSATSWANRVDLSTRMFQFFNHYLKGETMPEWMEKGVPAIQKGENLGY